MNKRHLLTISAGAVYALVLRMLDLVPLGNLYDPFNITFVFIVPVCVGLIPVFMGGPGVYNSVARLFFYPILSMFLFMVVAYITHLEDIMCFIVVYLPYFIIAGAAGLVGGAFLKLYKDKKSARVLFLPLILIPLESQLDNTTSHYSESYSVVISTSQTHLWKNLLSVPEIRKDEISTGFFYWAGIPHPVKSKLVEDKQGLHRIGYFSNGMQLYEHVTITRPLHEMHFAIDIKKSHIPASPITQHALKRGHFSFTDITYSIKKINNNRQQLTLRCDYSITSHLNGYANFWGSRIIHDFEVTLLDALKLKLEKPLL